MSNTSNNMAQVSKMIDAGWRVTGLWKNDMGTYSATATNENKLRIKVAYEKWCKLSASSTSVDDEMNWESFYNHDEDEVVTDDFTPEQALVRLAYKVFGECEGVEAKP